MKPLRLKKRIERWKRACGRENIQFLRSSDAYNSYINGETSFHHSFSSYLKACQRHLLTDYDEFWIETQEERETQAKSISKILDISIEEALSKVNNSYKPMLRKKALNTIGIKV